MTQKLPECRKCGGFRRRPTVIAERLEAETERIETGRKAEQDKLESGGIYTGFAAEDRAAAVAYISLKVWLEIFSAELQASLRRLCTECYKAQQPEEPCRAQS